ncbi:protein lethal(2)essential for life-like [Schistocerca americana]|uniref:protein lethal(2)essential for life-like n=1 Tax=Schistocerca americana TaxID=7009 RepID=UPI001F4F5DAF|nr:protein lethal(2)essential for life-like [Schistocerca americana]XP_046999944.1 protein lethal(2)essential for life-like [Schistocerca americana]XP_049963198.1 protein lethal(2)essential for life-like [Schistocerca serialis cubense]
MSVVPLLWRDWWDDWEPRTGRLLDQHFGLGLSRDELLSGLGVRSPLLRPTGYLRPWRSLARQDSGTSAIAVDKDRFQVSLDVQQFTPNEITVKTVGNAVIVEGKHEERPDEHGFVSRHFVRRYLLPKDVEVDAVVSNLSSDGVLTVTAPKKTAVAAGERVVPVIQTGVPAVKSAAPASPEPTTIEIKEEK